MYKSMILKATSVDYIKKYVKLIGDRYGTVLRTIYRLHSERDAILPGILPLHVDIFDFIEKVGRGLMMLPIKLTVMR